MRRPARLKSRSLFLSLAALCLASGCRTVHGPRWSPDGHMVAYTVSRSAPKKPVDQTTTDLYVLEPDSDPAEPLLIARNAGFPQWAADGSSLYYLGKKNKSGFYTAILRYVMGDEGLAGGASEVAFESPQLRLVGFQLDATGALALLCSARNIKPGSPQQVEFLRLADNKRTKLKQLGNVYSPVLTPDGLTLAYAQKKSSKPGSVPYVAILEFGQDELKPEVVFPTDEYNEPGADTYVLHAFSDSDRFLFYAPGGKAVWTVRRNGKLQRYPLPTGYTTPWMVSVTVDGKRAFLTLGRPVGGEMRFTAHELDFSRGKFRLLKDGATSKILGGHAVSPRMFARSRDERLAWLSPAGLAIGVPGKARYYPQTAMQYVNASEYYIKQADADLAVQAALKAAEIKPSPLRPEVLDRAEAMAYLAAGKGDRAGSAWARKCLLYPVGVTPLRYVFPTESGIPRHPGTGSASELREMEKFCAAAPGDQLLKHLHAALAARMRGDHKDALESYRQAQLVCPDEALAGGVRFLQAMAAVESGDLYGAGEYWENAARGKHFPQAHYAAGLSAIAFALFGSQDSLQRADTILRLGSSMDSILKEDFKKLLSGLKDKRYKHKTQSQELAKSHDGKLRTWVDITRYVLPQASLRPHYFIGGSGGLEKRRLGARSVTVSDIQIAGLAEGTKSLARIPRPITVPTFSPSGELISFLAKGEVFPLPSNYCAVFVLDLSGRILHGDARVQTTGQLKSRTIVTDATWSGPRDLKFKGFRVDVWGNQTSFQDTVSLTGR